ncbi:TonB family protein [Mucilaginibacter gracilis]|uniref:TonB family protein n=1 Tax=Mucilaginibacter gracilis TaxID=423350 RepID=A0A495J5G4_9SPHI|nr:energy transducer TonB [Mucilaginibacter gracilis]RKR83604.1 TonB family protein [Mucilaginibacter gracilis]
MTRFIFALLLFTVPFNSIAQKVTVTKLSDSKFNNKAIDFEPQFPGGAKAFYKYISKNIAYDKDAKVKDMQGAVTVSMAIETDGRITDAQITSGISPIVDKEVLRVINASPLWKPGKQHGKPVKVRYTFKIVLSNTK